MFYPPVSEIQPKELLKLKAGKAHYFDEFEVDPDEWKNYSENIGSFS